MPFGERSAVCIAAAMAAMASASITYLIIRRSSSSASAIPAADDGDKQLEVNALAYNRLNPILQTAGRAKVARTPTAYFRNRPNATHVIRIALTGGPCGGKSSALAHLRRRATAEGFDVYCAPEVATLLLNSGYVIPADPDQMFYFQFAVCTIQLAIERNLTTIVQGTGRPSIIIFDRGLLDSKGYMPLEMWQRVLGGLTTSGATDKEGESDSVTVGVTEDYCLKRYDGVVHMATAADGAEQFYKSGTVTDDSGNTVVRRESKEEAVAMDMKMRECWSAHPGHHIIGNEGTFQDKVDATVRVIMKLAEETHPSEVTRARIVSIRRSQIGSK